MARDKNPTQRYELNQKVLSKEREIDELHVEKRQALQSLENFEEVMMRSFREIQEIEDNLNQRNHKQNTFSETQEKKNYFTQLITRQQEETEVNYRKTSQQLEVEREIIQRERDNLVWD